MTPHGPAALNLARGVKRRVKEVLWYARKTRCGVEWLRNAAIDRKYGGYCGGRAESRFAGTGAHGTSSADYYQLKKLFEIEGARIRPDDVLVDVGCGKGRIINYWLESGCKNRIYGLELDPDIAANTARRLSRFPNVSILPGDAIENLPAGGTLFFLFNPFNAAVMQAFKQRVREKFSDKPVRILYFHCKSVHVFQEDPEWNVELHHHLFYQAALITMRPHHH